MQSIKQLALLASILILALYACKEPEGIGLDVLPDGEEMPIAWIDTFTIEAKTVRFDSVRTSGRGTYAIGDFGDPIFGRVQSQLYTQYKLNALPGPFNSSYTVDSVILNLDYAGSYGRIDKLRGEQHIGVFEITEDLDETGTYYSDDTLTGVSTTPLGEKIFTPDLLNDIRLPYDTLDTSMRIKLDKSLGERIVASDSLNDNESFSNDFKGLAVRSLRNMVAPDFGGILFIDINSQDSRLELYYHTDEDTLNYLFNINNNNAVYTQVSHQFSTEVADAISGGYPAGEEKLYVQSLAGTRIRINFPHLRNLNNLGAVAVNKAEIVLPVDENSLDDFGLPPILTVNSINAGDSAFVINDQLEPNGINYYGGIYDSDNKEYVFNVARHIQSILSNPDQFDYGLYISSLNAVDSKRGVYNGPKHPTTPLKLRMTYTIID